MLTDEQMGRMQGGEADAYRAGYADGKADALAEMTVAVESVGDALMAVARPTSSEPAAGRD